MAYFQGKFKPKNPEKYLGDVNEIVYRSGWEFKYMRQLDLDKRVKKWSSEEIIIRYLSPLDRRFHRYYPDFFVEYVNNRKELVEIKPYRECFPPKATAKKSKKQLIKEVKTYQVNKAKWAYARQFCKANKMHFKVLTEKDLFIKRKK